MAGRPRNRLELRRQYEAAEPLDPMEDDSEETFEGQEEGEEEVKPKKKKAAPKKEKAVKAAKPAARMRIVWQVVNDAFKPVATFAYADRAGAEAKIADLVAKGKGNHFIQKVKEAMPDDAPGLGASLPRPAAPAPSRAAKAAVVEVEEEEIDEEPEDEEPEDEEPEADEDE